jgi:hypothetical protein
MRFYMHVSKHQVVKNVKTVFLYLKNYFLLTKILQGLISLSSERCSKSKDQERLSESSASK